MKPFYALLGVLFIAVTVVFFVLMGRNSGEEQTVRLRTNVDEIDTSYPTSQPQQVETRVIETERVVPVEVPVKVGSTSSGEASSSSEKVQRKPAGMNQQQSQGNQPVEVIQRKTISFNGPESEQTVVANTPAEWADFWEQHATGQPPVQFNPDKETLVAIFLGSRNTGGYSVELDSVRQENGSIHVYYKERKPGMSQAVTQAFTTPGLVITLPKTTRQIVVEEKQS